jgi:hypothetical protein
VHPVRRPHLILALLLVCLAVTPASAQFPLGRRPATDGPELLMPRRAPFTLTPSIAVTGEYDDNVRFNNDARRSDLITTITPGITFSAEQRTWRVYAAYDFSARLYARDADRNRAFDRQNFVLDGSYDVSPTFGISLSETFSFDTGINAFAPEGVVTGRDRAWHNTLRPAATVRLDPLTTLRAGGTWTIARFARGELRDSDTWRADAAVDRMLTRRLRGTLGYEIAFFDIETAPGVTTHTPRVGATYELTPTLSGSLAGGPTFEQREGRGDRITPAVAANLTQRFRWGAATLGYDRSVGTAGGLGGTTDNQTIGASVAVTTLRRGLTIEFAPQYRTFKSRDAAIGVIDVTSISIPLQATYLVTPWFGFTAGYSFLRQRSDSRIIVATTGTTLGNDVDQNRVFFGVLVGYPIRYD